MTNDRRPTTNDCIHESELAHHRCRSLRRQERKTSAAALAESFYAKIESDDPKIGAFLTLSKERAMAKAAEMDALAAKGEKLPPLGGVPVGIKDVMVTKGVRTTAGSKILGNYIPPYDCTAVARLEAAGAVVLGKMNCDEFAMGSSNENSAWKPVHNPRDLSAFPAVLRADRRRRWRRTWRWRRWAPIPAARFASRRRFAAWSD